MIRELCERVLVALHCGEEKLQAALQVLYCNSTFIVRLRAKDSSLCRLAWHAFTIRWFIMTRGHACAFVAAQLLQSTSHFGNRAFGVISQL